MDQGFQMKYLWQENWEITHHFVKILKLFIVNIHIYYNIA